jgi:hypothetical protein
LEHRHAPELGGEDDERRFEQAALLRQSVWRVWFSSAKLEAEATAPDEASATFSGYSPALQISNS